MRNLYLMWSIERVAMLYDLQKINGKEWYPSGADSHQKPGSGRALEGWPTLSRRHPTINTCFALLFLKRSNLVQDLTQNLRLFTGIRDPEK